MSNRHNPNQTKHIWIAVSHFLKLKLKKKNWYAFFCSLEMMWQCVNHIKVNIDSKISNTIFGRNEIDFPFFFFFFSIIYYYLLAGSGIHTAFFFLFHSISCLEVVCSFRRFIISYNFYTIFFFVSVNVCICVCGNLKWFTPFHESFERFDQKKKKEKRTWTACSSGSDSRMKRKKKKNKKRKKTKWN